MELTNSQKIALKAFHDGKSFFLTGKAGTGKSFITREIIEECAEMGKEVLVCAPTGIAAINVGGATIHSTFGATTGVLEPGQSCKSKLKIKVLQAADVILIDEISMCRCDLFEFVMNTIFSLDGNKQIILVGDFFQLPPVLSGQEYDAYNTFYNSIYPFRSALWKKANIDTIELTEVVRTTDTELIKTLDDLRVGKPNFATLKKSIVMKPDDSAISICSTNKKAKQINDLKLNKLENKTEFVADVEGTFKDKPTDEILSLAPGARIMMLNNSENWVNGSLGAVEKVDEAAECIFVKLDNGFSTWVEKYTWTQYEYCVEFDKKKKKDVLVRYETASYTQLPVKLAWAITVHKSQGQTYDKVNIYTERMFAEGQLYVALSRCKSAAGMKIIGDLSEKGLICSEEVLEFMIYSKKEEIIDPYKGRPLPFQPYTDEMPEPRRTGRGGARKGGGRPAKYAGFVMKTIRVPAAFENDIFDFIDELVRKESDGKRGLPSG